MPLDTSRKPLKPAESPLRILIVVSQPTDMPPVVSAPVIEVIKELAKSYPIQIDTLDEPTIDNFLDKLKETMPHVLHFIGHGRFNKAEQKGAIALLKPDQKSAEWCEDAIFAEYFVNARVLPRLIFLHLCEGGSVDLEANFAGLAPRLMRSKIQAVVAMQYPITNKAAIAFSRAFYRELAKGEPIDDAVQQGRYKIIVDDPTAYNNRVFGTPVLYMHSQDGIILPKKKVRDIIPPPSTTPTTQVGTSPEKTLVTPDKTPFAEVIRGPDSSNARAADNLAERSTAPINRESEVIREGLKRLMELRLSDPDRFADISQKLEDIKKEITGKSLYEMKQVLQGYLRSQLDTDFKSVIESMIIVVLGNMSS
jgi:hypothetical protein